MTRRELIDNFILSMEKERISLGFTQAKMAQRLEISTSGYKKMIAGETAKIDLYIAYQLYVLTGKLLYELCGETSEQTEIFSRIHRLSSTQLRFVKGITDFEYAFQSTNGGNDAEDFVNLLTLTGNMEDGMILDSFNIEKINVASYRRRFGADLHCALKVNSDHFFPVYQSGDILLISLSSPRDGDTAIFVNRETGRIHLRRFRQSNTYLLEPINHFGIPFTVDFRKKTDMDKWIQCGRVLSKMR